MDDVLEVLLLSWLGMKSYAPDFFCEECPSTCVKITNGSKSEMDRNNLILGKGTLCMIISISWTKKGSVNPKNWEVVGLGVEIKEKSN